MGIDLLTVSLTMGKRRTKARMVRISASWISHPLISSRDIPKNTKKNVLSKKDGSVVSAEW